MRKHFISPAQLSAIKHSNIFCHLSRKLINIFVCPSLPVFLENEFIVRISFGLCLFIRKEKCDAIKAAILLPKGGAEARDIFHIFTCTEKDQNVNKNLDHILKNLRLTANQNTLSLSLKVLAEKSTGR